MSYPGPGKVTAKSSSKDFQLRKMRVRVFRGEPDGLIYDDQAARREAFRECIQCFKVGESFHTPVSQFLRNMLDCFDVM